MSRIWHAELSSLVCWVLVTVHTFTVACLQHLVADQKYAIVAEDLVEFSLYYTNSMSCLFSYKSMFLEQLSHTLRSKFWYDRLNAHVTAHCSILR